MPPLAIDGGCITGRGIAAGLLKADLEASLPRVAELPFDSDRKRMSTVHQLPADRSTLPYALSVLVSSTAIM